MSATCDHGSYAVLMFGERECLACGQVLPSSRADEVRASLYRAGVPVERLDAAVDAVMQFSAAAHTGAFDA